MKKFRVQTRVRLGCLAVLAFLVVAASGADLAAQSSDPSRQTGHFKARKPAQMDKPESLRVYNAIVEDLAAGYRLSRNAIAKNYLEWRQYNDAPYRSRTHGERFINNYGNRLARGYDRMERGATLPRGAVIAKDSFTASADGSVKPGPLFIMEKMAPGFNRQSGDWRYTMILPDGSLFGQTKGENAEQVRFCIGCHATRANYDHLFFVPKDYRTRFLKTE